ncbi:alpha-glucosidase [Tahibacter amnicola]|uniref:Alpha-glucosidase family protein n=1 Tax=Tahibacter amnicola TaxID=2976241 RepID=A0ABY6BLW2_9GAMM|nr:alpha-glucosidase [Tahibacter amnicola]UXI70764.1 alpha-glucosidase family protein [Tahibacter amnicola]
MNSPDWWRGAIIYQIYPRSFQDANGDGVGDLRGITQRLDYVASLGVDAIWISPFFKSPMHDFGYDIADYRAVDPLFGTLADFDTLLERAHALGLKVIIDQVLSHTSAEHPWFLESREDRLNPRADWYVWADARADGSPPNNWLSIFGGVAWQWEPRRGQYYLHNFLASQPDLNFHHPDVRRATLENVRFWLERGVDGLRLDAINFCFHDRLLRDNPPKPASERSGRGFGVDNPYAFQYHWYNNTQTENIAFLAELRALMDAFPGTVTLGEISAEDSIATMAEYTRHGRLHMGYSFELLTEDGSPGYIRSTVERLEAQMDEGWPCWAISNHDVARVASRWHGDATSHARAAQLTALAASLRGSVCVYQGEELGLTEAELPYEAIRDPYGRAFWPRFKGRDGCRTPMVWDDSEDAGFTAAQPWLPIPAAHRERNVARQLASADSTLRRLRRFLRFRSGQPALRTGAITFVPTPAPVIMFYRRSAQQTLLVAFNLSAQSQSVVLPGGDITGHRGDHGLDDGVVTDGVLQLPAHGAWFGECGSLPV